LDAGGTCTRIRRERLERTGVEPSEARKFESIEGKALER
jgi:hypothetical protein